MKQIPLTKGKFALVDDEDYERLAAMGKWQCVGRGKKIYAIKMFWKKKHVIMHRLIMNASDGLEVDHRNGNGLDNQKSNLRVCGCIDNGKNLSKRSDNTSGFKGVNWHKQKSKWRARIQFDFKRIDVGYFDCPIEAARAYNAAALKYHKEFANLNQIP
jgi:AP2 domain